jgi:3-dehydroquinate synthetase
MCVVADTRLLSTLSARAFAAGMAEVAKIGMILDAALFEALERNRASLGPADEDTLTPLIARAIELKAAVVERDERESGERMLLNYGHTVGHALEAVAGYGALLHGEAVAIGMHAAARIACSLGVLAQADAARQAKLLDDLHLPRRFAAPADEVLARLRLDKKRAGSTQRWVLAECVGAGAIRAGVPDEVVREAVAAVTNT